MILYILFLLPVALAAYFLGSMDTIVLASNFAFHRNLLRFGTGNRWFSNFRRVYGLRGFIRLLLVELARDLLAVLFGGLVLAIKGHAQAGFAFAGFCLVVGRLYPVLYDLKGSHATLCMLVQAMFVAPAAGAAALISTLLVLLVSRYLSLSTVAGAVIYAVVAILMVEEPLMRNLALITAGLVILKHIPAMLRVLARREEKLVDVKDLSYKFDENF